MKITSWCLYESGFRFELVFTMFGDESYVDVDNVNRVKSKDMHLALPSNGGTAAVPACRL